MFILGVVSNAWGALLPATSLAEQCRRAAEAGYGYVELRQRALAECEERVPGDERPWPLAEALAGLREGVPGLGYNLAVEAPFMTEPVAVDAYLRRCAAAAAALGGDPPVLRLVDLSPAPTLLAAPARVAELGRGVAGIASALWEDGVGLALENSRQPVSALEALIRAAAAELAPGVPPPRLCWDPHNQMVQQLLPEDPGVTALHFPLDRLFEFHFKQAEGGRLLDDVRDGEIDWRSLLTALGERGYRGPALFEIPPGPDIWDHLENSTTYVRGLLAG